MTNKEIGSILQAGVEDKDTDTIWWVIDELLGKHENAA